MREDLFRKESLEKIENPDDLDKYVKVTNPKIWILLVAIVLLLTGACVWGFCGRLNTTVKGFCISERGEQACFIPESFADRINPGDIVKITDQLGEVISVNTFSTTYFEVAAKYGHKPLPSETNETIRGFYTMLPIEDGNYYIDVIVESKAPFSFVFNY